MIPSDISSSACPQGRQRLWSSAETPEQSTSHPRGQKVRAERRVAPELSVWRGEEASLFNVQQETQQREHMVF